MTPIQTPNPYVGHAWVPGLNMGLHFKTKLAFQLRDFTCSRS